MLIDPKDDFGQGAVTEEEAPFLQSLGTSMVASFRRRLRVWLIAFFSVFLIGSAYALMIPSKYGATAIVKINPSSSAALGQISGNERPDQNVFDTEVSIMKSHNVALAVLQRLTAPGSGVNLPHWQPIAKDASVSERNARLNQGASALLGSLAADRDGMTYLIDISYASTDPQVSAAVANAFAEEYIKFSLGGRREKASTETGFLDQKLSQLDSQAAQADARLAEFSAANGMMVKDGPDSIDQQLGSLAGQQAQAESEAASARAKLQAARAEASAGGVESVSAVIGSTVIAGLKAQKATLIQQQSEARTRYGPKHPSTIAINEQLGQIDAQIRDEARHILDSLNSDAKAASARAGSLSGEMSHLRGMQGTATKASANAETLKRQADAAHQSYNQLAEQARQVSRVAESSLNQAQIIERALPPPQPTSPNRILLMVAAFFGAGVVATSLIFLIEAMAQGMYSAQDAEKALKLPVVAMIPQLDAKDLADTAGGKAHTPHSYLMTHKSSAYSETYRALRRSIAEFKVLAITSAVPNEGKSTAAVSLARICAMAGERVILVDADVRRASVLEAIELSVEKGLLEVLSGEITLDEAIIPDDGFGTAILPVAATSFPTNDLFADPQFAEVLAELKKRYDRIIFDTPPVLSLIDSRHVAALSDATLMVVRWGSTPAKAAQNALKWLQADAATHVAGVVMTLVDKTSDLYGQIYYSYRYSHYYRKD